MDLPINYHIVLRQTRFVGLTRALLLQVPPFFSAVPSLFRPEPLPFTKLNVLEERLALVLHGWVSLYKPFVLARTAIGHNCFW